MKDFVEKLIKSLEEEKEKSFAKYRESFELHREEFWRGRIGGLMKATEIVNQLAEEYKQPTITIEQLLAPNPKRDEFLKMKFSHCIDEEYGKDTNVRSNDGWIPCSERLPEDGQKVLCSIDGNIAISRYGGEGFWVNGRIEAWMPLPKKFEK